FSPGADGPEVVTGTPVFRWEDDSSEDAYELTVVNALGETVWGPITVPGASGTDPQVTYAGPALAPGYYQWRVASSAGTCAVGGTTAMKYLARSEDLKGVFVVE
ncbi:MAG TPA: hypothetical protein VD838_22235, partial [Anaeromyxobacteraceae bacterium]|nr:hypothetical protein [Anaeromyxobacteraceae bacterium]